MLRMLHTSDWHLGQLLREQERSFEHHRFLNWLRDVIREREIDVLLLAGDVFDVANPPAAAQRQFYDFIAATRAECPGLQVVVIAGNHDSPSRLEAPHALVGALGVSVIGRVPWRATVDGSSDEPALDPMLLPLRSRAGNTEAWCLAVPFLRPGDVPRVDSDTDAYALGIQLLYRQLVDLGLGKREPGQALVAMGHCAVTAASRHAVAETRASADFATESTIGDEREESENEAIRPIILGGLERLDDRMFPTELAYVALGHLHRAGCIGGRLDVRYSGSPLPLSFAEQDYRHQVVLVELDGERARRIESIEIPRAVDMLRIPDVTASLSHVLASLSSWTPTAAQLEQPVWLEVALSSEQQPVFDLVAQIDEALKDKPVRAWRLVERKRENASTFEPATLLASSLDEVQRLLEPEQLLALAWKRVNGEVAVPDELLHCLREALATDGEL